MQKPTDLRISGVTFEQALKRMIATPSPSSKGAKGTAKQAKKKTAKK